MRARAAAPTPMRRHATFLTGRWGPHLRVGLGVGAVTEGIYVCVRAAGVPSPTPTGRCVLPHVSLCARLRLVHAVVGTISGAMPIHRMAIPLAPTVRAAVRQAGQPLHHPDQRLGLRPLYHHLRGSVYAVWP